jgi:hypothetical protein
MASPARIFKKGEVIFKEGEKPTHLFMIQSGMVSVCIQRPKKNVEILSLGPQQVLGDLAFSGISTQPYSAIATSDTKIVEIPFDVYKQTVDGTGQMIKVLIKSMADKLKTLSSEVRTAKMEKEPLPCPEDQIPQVFGAIFHVTHHKGQKDPKKPSEITIEWSQLRSYAQRIFGQPAKRLEQALCILSKLKICSFEMGKPPEDPEGPDQITTVHFSDLGVVEAFFEFYQYHYYKGGSKSEILKVEEGIYSTLHFLLTLTQGLEPDRLGIVTMDFQKVIEKMKSDFGINLNSDSFLRMEQKGLFVKRHQRQDGQVVLQFELKEFKNIQQIWRIIKEIEKWNEKGFVDMTEEELKPKKKINENSCPQCQATIQAKAKFCSECGYKVAV